VPGASWEPERAIMIEGGLFVVELRPTFELFPVLTVCESLGLEAPNRKFSGLRLRSKSVDTNLRNFWG
jgi:hypothetical protein